MTIEFPKETRERAIESIQRYAEQNLSESLGNLAANELLRFFLQEIAPAVYNQAVADVQERLQARVAEIDIEVHADEFQYWQKAVGRKKT
jgi:uncharacterized protein (DUF2164 family)